LDSQQPQLHNRLVVDVVVKVAALVGLARVDRVVNEAALEGQADSAKADVVDKVAGQEAPADSAKADVVDKVAGQEAPADFECPRIRCKKYWTATKTAKYLKPN
jgi:hypothetical protein